MAARRKQDTGPPIEGDPAGAPEVLPRAKVKPPVEKVKDPAKGGRPRTQQWNPEKSAIVQSCVAFGIPHRQIAIYLGMKQTSMERVYAGEIAKGAVAANYLVAKQLYNLATKGTGREKVAACIFWCKTRMGWAETVKTENTGAGGGPIEHVVKSRRSTSQFDKMSAEELDDYINDNLRTG